MKKILAFKLGDSIPSQAKPIGVAVIKSKGPGDEPQEETIFYYEMEVTDESTKRRKV